MRAKMEKKDFESAKLYVDLSRFESAQQSFENVLKDYPETGRAEEIRYLMAQSQYEYARQSYVTRQRERYTKAVKQLKELENVRYQSTGSRP